MRKRRAYWFFEVRKAAYFCRPKGILAERPEKKCVFVCEGWGWMNDRREQKGGKVIVDSDRLRTTLEWTIQRCFEIGEDAAIDVRRRQKASSARIKGCFGLITPPPFSNWTETVHKTTLLCRLIRSVALFTSEWPTSCVMITIVAASATVLHATCRGDRS